MKHEAHFVNFVHSKYPLSKKRLCSLANNVQLTSCPVSVRLFSKIHPLLVTSGFKALKTPIFRL